MKAIILGDAMIPGKGFEAAWKEYLNEYGDDLVVGNWEEDWDQLQYRRLEVEKHGPDIEPVDEVIKAEGEDAEALLGLFVPVSRDVIAAMPNLKIVGVSRAGLENVDVEAATENGVLVFHVRGRNAHAVSDFTVGMMLAETRNIARAHHSIKQGGWEKEFANSEFIPELRGKCIGLVGFGHIGRLVTKKLSGFDVEVVVYDPYTDAAAIEAEGASKVELEELVSSSDYISMHARLGEDNKHMIGKEQFDMMKPTTIFINTARAGLVDQEALIEALQERKILGAALDVFETEPIPEDSPLYDLDNVTLTTHIAGTTAEVLTNSPYMLTEDIEKLFKEEDPQFIVNPEVLENEEFKKWLDSVK